MTVVLSFSVMMNAILLAAVVTGSDGAGRSTALELSDGAPVVTPSVVPRPARPAARPTPSATSVSDRSKSGPSALSAAAIAAVERRILNLMVASPRRKLPPALIDQATGLAPNNLQASCRNRPGALLCVIRPAEHKPKQGLYVRYRPTRDGRGVFTWYPYRSG